MVRDPAPETRAHMEERVGRDPDLDDLPRLRATVGGLGHDAAPEIGPGLASRVPISGPHASWSSVDYESVRAIAETAYTGDGIYGVDNWRKGIPVSDLINHALEHIFRMLEGDQTEPHLEHAMWNLGKIRWMARHKPEMVDVPMIRQALGLGG